MIARPLFPVRAVLALILMAMAMVFDFAAVMLDRAAAALTPEQNPNARKDTNYEQG